MADPLSSWRKGWGLHFLLTICTDTRTCTVRMQTSSDLKDGRDRSCRISDGDSCHFTGDRESALAVSIFPCGCYLDAKHAAHQRTLPSPKLRTESFEFFKLFQIYAWRRIFQWNHAAKKNRFSQLWLRVEKDATFWFTEIETFLILRRTIFLPLIFTSASGSQAIVTQIRFIEKLETNVHELCNQFILTQQIKQRQKMRIYANLIGAVNCSRSGLYRCGEMHG